jgi:hypothetical protein
MATSVINCGKVASAASPHLPISELNTYEHGVFVPQAKLTSIYSKQAGGLRSH